MTKYTGFFTRVHTYWKNVHKCWYRYQDFIV